MEIFKPKFTRKLCRVALPIPPQPLSFYRPQRTQACPGSGDVISVPPNLVIPVLGERCDGCVPFHGYRASFGIQGADVTASNQILMVDDLQRAPSGISIGQNPICLSLKIRPTGCIHNNPVFIFQSSGTIQIFNQFTSFSVSMFLEYEVTFYLCHLLIFFPELLLKSLLNYFS